MKKLFLSAFLLLGGLVSAQTPATGDSGPAEVQALESPEGEPETRTTAWQKIAARLPRLSGYVQAGYRYSDDASEFLVKRVRLSLAGDISPKFDYKIQFEFRKPQLLDAFIRYRPFRQLNVRVGQYKVPFSIENTECSPTRMELIEYPLVLQKLMGSGDICGLSSSDRDLGASLCGGFFKRDGYCIVNYDLGVFNGEGINTRDANKSKDLAARLAIRPVEGVLLSGSYYRGEYGDAHLQRERYAAGISYDRGAVVVRSEWIGGVTGMADTGGSMTSDGWYVTAAWRAPRRLMFVARFENFTPDTARRSATRQNNYTAGVAWSPVQYLRCQFNYTYEDYAAVAGNNVLSLMFTGMF